MKMDPANLDELAHLIGENFTPTWLEEMVHEHGVIADYATLQKEATQNTPAPRTALARALLDKYNERELVPQFAQQLLGAHHGSDFRDRVFAFTVEGISGTSQQAMLASRDYMMDLDRLSGELINIKSRICCLAGSVPGLGGPTRANGTGFLVGPDLVLTARHVVKTLYTLADKSQAQNYFHAVFGHTGLTPAPFPGQSPDPKHRIVRLHKDWEIAASDELDKDGEIDLDQRDVKELLARLDFALIRLEEEVGRECVKLAGGQVRRWIELETGTAVDIDTRVFIPQHPDGNGMFVEFGRVKRAKETCSRILYDACTTKGSSGAPCFNKDCKVVAMHNATYRPTARPQSNQAVEMRRIHPEIVERLKIEGKAAEGMKDYIRLWNVAPPKATIRPIIGRDRFLNWLKEAGRKETTERSQRVYVATSTLRRAGRSYSIDILKAYLPDPKKNPVMVFDGKENVLPVSVEDMIDAIFTALAIPASVIRKMPPRPTHSANDSKDGDKLNTWRSEDVPKWLAGVLKEHREIRAVAPGAPDAAGSVNQIKADLKWNAVWVAFDEAGIPMSDDIRELSAAMIGKQDEASLDPEFRAFRWLFLGYQPSLNPKQATQDALDDPDAVTEADLSKTMEAAFSARNLDAFIGTSAGFAITYKVSFDQQRLDIQKTLEEIYAMADEKLKEILRQKSPKTRLQYYSELLANDIREKVERVHG